MFQNSDLMGKLKNTGFEKKFHHSNPVKDHSSD